MCDDIGDLLYDDAAGLLASGIRHGMVSERPAGDVPKYVWAVGDNDDEIYEAKTHANSRAKYHGYRLNDNERDFRKYVLAEWRKRCP